MASVAEVETELDSGMGTSDVRSPEVKSLMPDDDEEEEVCQTMKNCLFTFSTKFFHSGSSLSIRFLLEFASCIHYYHYSFLLRLGRRFNFFKMFI